MRLIDANALKEKSRRCFVDGFHGSGIYGEMEIVLIEDISLAPAVDAVPVVHGRWAPTIVEVYVDGGFRTGAPHCTICHKQAHRRTLFCPNCGAKMDGGEDNAEK